MGAVDDWQKVVELELETRKVRALCWQAVERRDLRQMEELFFRVGELCHRLAEIEVRLPMGQIARPREGPAADMGAAIREEELRFVVDLFHADLNWEQEELVLAATGRFLLRVMSNLLPEDEEVA